MLRMNSRGQEEAPFELLISVIIMGFVLAIGLMAMNELKNKECQGQVDNTMKELKITLETVTKGQGKPSFSFRMPSCYDQRDSQLRIKNENERIICSRICGGNRFDCTLLQFHSTSKGSNYSSIVCLDIPATVDFPMPDAIGSPCKAERYKAGTIEYEVVTWKDNPIMPGDYILANEYSIMSDQPRVCIYKRKVA